jgi:hypothetical protein
MEAIARTSRGALRPGANAGICCMLAGILALSLSDASVKVLDGRYRPCKSCSCAP